MREMWHKVVWGMWGQDSSSSGDFARRDSGGKQKAPEEAQPAGKV